MSCFVVDKKHIDYLASYFEMHQRDLWLYRADRGEGNWGLTPCDVGQILWNENRRSYESRYKEIINWDVYKFIPYGNLGRLNDYRQVVKACDCLNYQSCETEDRKETDAHTILHAIRAHAINCLIPDSLMWEVTE